MDARKRGVNKPAMIAIEKGRVQALDLVDVDGILAVPDRGYRYIGDVFQEVVQVDGTNAKRWFAMTLVQSTLGPFTQKQLAVDALLDWNHIRAAQVQETSAPLF